MTDDTQRPDQHTDKAATEPTSPPAVTPDDHDATANALAEEVKERLARVESDTRSLEGDLDEMLKWPQPWAIADYVPSGVFGKGAKKLSESYVAPLVAAARGYREFDESNVADIGPAFGMTDRRSQQMRRVYDAAGRSGVLMMPWFAVDTVVAAETRAGAAKHDSVQFRPGTLPPEVEGVKQRKYEFVSGDQTPIAVHPSIPASWIEASGKVLLAEGLLKGDAALTGYLLDHGFTKDELSYDGDGDARKRLTAMLNTIPDDERLTIFTMAGVWNWKQNHEWNALRLIDREVWLGVDGDVATKPGVYKATHALWNYLTEKKKADVKLLSPVISIENSHGETDKVGIDDYLAKYGTWSQLLGCLADVLPPQPADLQAEKGEARIDSDGCSSSRYVITEEDSVTGKALDGRWVPFLPIGGRIHAMVADRIPTDKELSTGAFGADVSEDSISWNVEIEIRFRNGVGEVESYMVSGPHHILNFLPEKWHDKGAHIPGPVMVHPEWPPRGKDAESWVKAVKSYAPERMVRRTRWACMGWVPVPGGVPVYVAGNHVIGGSDAESDNEEVLPGVTDDLLERAAAFGAGPDSGLTFDSQEYREEVRVAIEAVMKAYVTNNVWTNRANAAVVVAAGLRPALPIRPKAVMYFVGPKGTGKTFSGNAVIAFWQSAPGSLIPVPGSAKDTYASMELNTARSNIWVVDDLAPASSRRQSEDEKDKIGSLIRNTFNGAARGRSNANMESRKKNNPRALLVITAENEPTVSSELDRLVLCDIGYRSLNPETWPTDALRDMVESGGRPGAGAPALVSQAMVKYLRWCAAQPGSSWASVYEQVQQSRATVEGQAKLALETLGGRPRHADLSADLTLSFHWLRRIAIEVGCSDEVLRLLNSVDGLPNDVIGLVGTTARENQETSPGRALVNAITSVLRRGRAHIVSADDPSVPPCDPETERNQLSALGWVSNGGNNKDWRPAHGSEPIGWLVREKGEPVIIFDPHSAFLIAQQHSSLIPHGQGQRMSWASVTGEGLGIEDMLRTDKSGKRINSARKTTNGTLYMGYPVALSQILDGGATRDIDGEDEDDD